MSARNVPAEGEIVELGISAGSLVAAAIALFLYPSILMVCGAYIGAALGGGADTYAIFGVLAGLTVGCGTLRLYYSRGAGPLWVLLPSARGAALRAGRKKF